MQNSFKLVYNFLHFCCFTPESRVIWSMGQPLTHTCPHSVPYNTCFTIIQFTLMSLFLFDVHPDVQQHLLFERTVTDDQESEQKKQSIMSNIKDLSGICYQTGQCLDNYWDHAGFDHHFRGFVLSVTLHTCMCLIRLCLTVVFHLSLHQSHQPLPGTYACTASAPPASM